MSILLPLLLLGVLIFVHELGHFLFAKFSNVKVLKFSIGFGPAIISRKIGETEYALSAIPLGGYVKMYGEEPDEEVSEEDKARSFKNQPMGKKALILVAGAAFNILLTFVIYTALIGAGYQIPVPELRNLMPIIDEVVEGGPAAEAGLKKGDKVVSIGDDTINTWLDIVSLVGSNPDKPLAFVMQRGSDQYSATITPKAEKIKDRDGKEITIGRIGIMKTSKGIYTFVKSSSLLDAPAQGAYATYKMGIMIYESLWMIITGEISFKSVGGPVAIFSLSSKAADAGLIPYLLMMALISVNLGIFNLLPVPVLDGGHLMIMSIEAVRGKPLSESTVATAQKIGLVLLLALMVFVIYNDIFRLLSGKPLP
jgi:regulator of sigma E protease